VELLSNGLFSTYRADKVYDTSNSTLQIYALVSYSSGKPWIWYGQRLEECWFRAKMDSLPSDSRIVRPLHSEVHRRSATIF
jgi:hypothetical protein